VASDPEVPATIYIDPAPATASEAEIPVGPALIYEDEYPIT